MKKEKSTTDNSLESSREEQMRLAILESKEKFKRQVERVRANLDQVVPTNEISRTSERS